MKITEHGITRTFFTLGPLTFSYEKDPRATGKPFLEWPWKLYQMTTETGNIRTREGWTFRLGVHRFSVYRYVKTAGL